MILQWTITEFLFLQSGYSTVFLRKIVPVYANISHKPDFFKFTFQEKFDFDSELFYIHVFVGFCDNMFCS